MKYLKPYASILALYMLMSCNSTDKHKVSDKPSNIVKKDTSSHKNTISDTSFNKKDLSEIQGIVRQMLNWGESKNSIELIPVITDSKDSLCIGFDLDKVKHNLEVLKSTGYFSTQFINNYNQILLTLDREMKDDKFQKWSTGELPPFNFANDVDPWSDCQDVPYDTPNAYGLVEVHVISLNNREGKLYWQWGKLGVDTDSSWKKFTYKFKVKKEDGKWKISYLEGFDYDKSIQVS